jgi:hypothetical protein
MSVPLLAVLGSGSLAGLVHVVSGLDHLAALLPLSVGRRLSAFSTGARWGVGHSAGVAVIALLAVALKQRLDLTTTSVLGERLVGVALVAIGLLGIRRALRIRIHSHPHEHGEEGHAHLHAHLSGAEDGHARDREAHRHDHTAFLAGTLHGTAGGAHLLGVLPAVALADWLASGAYVAAFAAGTIVAMGVFAALVGEGTGRAAGSPLALRRLCLAAGAATVMVGIGWILLAVAPATFGTGS